MRSPADVHNPLATSLKSKVKKVVVTQLERQGWRMDRLEDTDRFIDDASTKSPELMQGAITIPGMVDMRRGMYYYFLAYAGIPGDIIEIGCWQGRSTSFLAQACKDSGNGLLHAVDTFGGNPGNERAYRVGADDLSDLEINFLNNMERLGLADQVRVHSGRSEDVAGKVLSEVGDVRMIVIDAEHTYEAVKAELALYADALAVGGLLVFDDYSKRFAGVARAVNEHLEGTGRYSTPLQDRGLLVVRRLR